MIKIGITGTREGLTDEQYLTIVRNIEFLKDVEELHHGDCLGADAQVAEIFDFHIPDVKIIGHPPTKSYLRAYSKVTDEFLPPKEFLDRNRDIVIASDIMYAFPKEMNEVLRSGTWATIRFAKKVKKPLIIFWPDGLMENI